MNEEQQISAQFAAIMMGGELSGDPADPDSPLGMFLAAGEFTQKAVLEMWARSGIVPVMFGDQDPATEPPPALF